MYIIVSHLHVSLVVLQIYSCMQFSLHLIVSSLLLCLLRTQYWPDNVLGLQDVLHQNLKKKLSLVFCHPIMSCRDRVFQASLYNSTVYLFLFLSTVLLRKCATSILTLEKNNTFMEGLYTLCVPSTFCTMKPFFIELSQGHPVFLLTIFHRHKIIFTVPCMKA